MKKIILVFALFTALIAAAQDCPEENIDLFKNRSLKVLPLSEVSQRSGYKGFFSDRDLKDIYKKLGKTTDYSALAGKVFKVVSYELYVDAAKTKKFKLLLENPETGRLYYDYNPYDCSVFPFEFIPLPPPPKPYVDPCTAIREINSSDGLKRIYESKNSEGVTFNRLFNDDGVNTAIEVNTPDVKRGQKGMSVSLSNGKKLERPDAPIIRVPGSRDTDYYVSLMILTEEEIELVKDYEIVKYTIGDIESAVEDGALLKTYFNCMLNKESFSPSGTKLVPLSCEDITTTVDKKNGNTEYATPEINGMSLTKVIGNNLTSYICSITLFSESMHIGNGVMISFEDEHLINYPDIKVTERMMPNGTYVYIAVFIIRKNDLSHFTTSKIKGVKVIDAVKPITRGGGIRKLASCLVEKQ